MEASGTRPALRYGGGDPGPVAAGTVHVECAAERLDAVAQAGQATAGGLGCAADAIVGDLEVKGVASSRWRVRGPTRRARASARW